MSRFTAIILVFVAGLLLGFLAAQSLYDVAAPLPDTTPTAPNPRRAPKELAAPGNAQPAAPDAPATNLQPSTGDHVPASGAVSGTPRTAAAHDDSTVSIPRKFFPKIQCMVFNTASNCVTDDIVELLAITPDERGRLDLLIAAIRTQVEEHELDRAAVTEQSPQRVVLKIAANPDAARTIEDAFVAGVQETLGERAAVFLERAQPYEATLFSNFGRNDVTLTVTRDENSSLLRVQSQQEYRAAGGGHGTVSTTTMANQMPDRWKKFFQAP